MLKHPLVRLFLCHIVIQSVSTPGSVVQGHKQSLTQNLLPENPEDFGSLLCHDNFSGAQDRSAESDLV